MNNFKNQLVLLVLFIAASATAQIGLGTRLPHPDAMLEVATTNKGILLPRVTLTTTTIATPLSAHVEGMTVYNTATTGDVTPGYYYNDGGKWVKLATSPGPQGIQGVAGVNGKSAYELAVTNGFNGTETQWLYSLVGPQGPQGIAGPAGANGANGSSAYQVAVANGYNGTETQWLASLVGATGPQGTQGIQGVAGSLGANGQGVPTGGTTGQVLAKVNDTNYNTAWVNPTSSEDAAQNSQITILQNSVTLNYQTLDNVNNTQNLQINNLENTINQNYSTLVNVNDIQNSQINSIQTVNTSQSNQISNINSSLNSINTNITNQNNQITTLNNSLTTTNNNVATLQSKVIPTGGTSGQVLAKVDGTDYNTQWVTNSSQGDLRLVNTSSHISQDAGNGSNGSNAGNTSVIAIGSGTGNSNTAEGSLFIGHQAGYSNSNGASNTFVGYQSGKNNTTGPMNTFFGYQAGEKSTNGNNNTYLGYRAGQNSANNTYWNTFVGSQTGQGNTTGLANSAFGADALKSNNNSGNAVFGSGSLSANTSGDENAVFGRGAIPLNTTGRVNTIVGSTSLYNSTTGSYNATLGAYSGYATTTGSNNTFLGFNSGNTNTTGSNNIVIGSDANAPSATSNNQLSIGNLIYGTGLDGTSNTISTGNIGIGTKNPTAKLDIAGTIKISDGSQGVGKVLTSDANGLASWIAPSGGGSSGGAKLELVATKIAAIQTLANANGTNTGDVVVFENVVTQPTIGTYNSTNNTYTVAESGLYFIQASVRTIDNAAPSSTTHQWLYIDINNTSLSGYNNIFGDYIGATPNNFPAGSKGRGIVNGIVYLNVGDLVNIKGLNANSSATNSIKNDGSAKLIIVKL